MAALALWIAQRLSGLPGWLPLMLFSVWVLKDLLLFPWMGRFYRSEPTEGRIIGERGTAITDLEPTGFVRVHGELWQAHSERRIPKGADIRVCDIHRLKLRVERDLRQRDT